MWGMEHLERMGRELKCPICLSLLHSAASLSCNHVFCNSCISKSMKSTSTCPVCKVPFHRRDIRPSPHMDSLVAIYKGMETDAGVDIFVSQGEAGRITSDDQESPVSKGTVGNEKKRKASENKSKNESLAGTEPMDLRSSVPSFPSKKRVHVTPYSISETPPKPEGPSKLEYQQASMDTAAAWKKAPVDQRGEPLFCPFFWMREDVEDDEDRVSGRSSPQQTGDTPPQVAPCFSDIKDEDDGDLTGKTPTSKSRVGEILDSEMFEWTQRPCSPELWLTPVKDQIREASRSDGSCEEEHRAPASGSLDGRRTADRTDQNPDKSRPSGRRESAARGKQGPSGKRVRRSRAGRSAESRKKNTSLQKRAVSSPLKDPKIWAALGRPSRSCARKLASRFQDNLEMDGKQVPFKKAEEDCPRGGGMETREKQKRTSPSSDEAIAEKLHVIPQDAVVASSDSSVGAPHPSDDKCSFCHSSEETEVSGEMIHYLDGRPVASDFNGGARIIHSHRLCAEWAPNVFFDGDGVVNLAAEVARSRRIRCSHCGVKGAALGCLKRSCRKSFHYTCAKLISGCHWDEENFVMLCPIHVSSRLLLDAPGSQRQGLLKSTHRRASRSQASTRQPWRWSAVSSPKWVLCCSSLSPVEKEAVSELAKLAGVLLSKGWSSAVTHVIASVDEEGACRRTLKYLMAIAEGKWILNMGWVNACLKGGKPFEEDPYEIRKDVHGMSDGPRLGRLRALRQEPKLFDGFKFYFTGNFPAVYRGYLQDLVTVAGGAVLQRKPVAKQGEGLSPAPVFIVYSLEPADGSAARVAADAVLERRRAEAAAVAEATGGRAATNRWVLDSIAGCRIQSLAVPAAEESVCRT
ncbi:unnamed protein product [Spirodela intermedia]|uniref:Uncharacterized protein n=1 Tax=Spirodela intermedia TaxID=51605 RepID=A0A7I8L5V1_SPIIN|nr:unnamed protein product [Spirodela intermedia]